MTVDPDSAQMMSNRISRILLVCNTYDNFALEEDGHIETQIRREYSDLNLSNPPVFVRAEGASEALELARSGESFDLVIALYNGGEMEVFDFSCAFKKIQPDTPIVLLSAFSREVYRKLKERATEDIDYIFCWNNSADLILAIIKLIEDKINADYDVLEGGARVIMLVEDSVRYYSSYLPLLYKLILQQNMTCVMDALNEKQLQLRKRSRPKILLATCYDEAASLYEKYKENMLGIISDIGFVIHKNDRSTEEKPDAGIELCKIIRKENPTLPFLMQSSQEGMRAKAEALGVGFVHKQSRNLIREVSEYIGNQFGFGDFVVTDPDTGIEIARARNLWEFENVLKVIPTKIYRTFADNNYISRWIFGRGIFNVGNELAPITINCDEDVAAAREKTVALIHEYRISQALGVVAAFNKDTFNDTIWFSRLGNGSLGGKARGLAFLNTMMQKYNLYDKWEGVRITVPRTLVVTTEYFDSFIEENGLQYVINADMPDEELLAEFVAATLPAELTEALQTFIKYVRAPLAVRSSSKLEDSYYQPFAGVYSTYMLPNVDNDYQKLRLISKAIKSVYASVFFSASRSYITASANLISEEKMAIVIQEICGEEQDGYYFPTLSGVARSYNFYPVGYEKPDEGICKIAYGLGKAVVDGDQVLRVSPKYPKNILQTSTPELTMSDTQKSMFALNLRPEYFKTSTDDSVNLDRIPISDCGRFSSLRRVVSTWDFENQRIVDSPVPEGPKYVTFAHILRYNSFPLAEIVDELLQIGQNEVKSGIEIEFAAILKDDPDSNDVFNVLQIRPISYDSSSTVVDWNAVNCEGALLYSENALGIGWINDVCDVIYLKRDSFNTLRTVEMASELSKLNSRMQERKRNYVLIGFGRWGSSIPSLGVPVKWGDISEVKAIVECSLPDFRVDPSQGTHFFQNLTSFNVGYINVDSYSHPGEYVDFDALDAMPAEFETEYLRLVHFPRTLRICVDGRGSRAVISDKD